jgi:ribosomal protein S16
LDDWNRCIAVLSVPIGIPDVEIHHVVAMDIRDDRGPRLIAAVGLFRPVPHDAADARFNHLERPFKCRIPPARIHRLIGLLQIVG